MNPEQRIPKNFTGLLTKTSPDNIRPAVFELKLSPNCKQLMGTDLITIQAEDMQEIILELGCTLEAEHNIMITSTQPFAGCILFIGEFREAREERPRILLPGQR